MSITPKAFLPFMNKALDDMASIALVLGDGRVNQRPDLPGANSPYAIMYHCVGMTRDWLGSVLGGRLSTRDREAEFHAEGTVVEICEAVRALKDEMQQDIHRVHGNEPLGFLIDLHGSMQQHTQGDVLLHVFRELTQHLGQMELTRDMLLARKTD